MLNKRALGAVGEEAAEKHLIENKYRIMEKNYRTCFGEIDIIARDKDYLVFVEVKLRRTDEFGLPIEAVGASKQKKIIKSALEYVKSRKLTDENIRFDVLIIGPEADRIEIVKSAFSTNGFYTY